MLVNLFVYRAVLRAKVCRLQLLELLLQLLDAPGTDPALELQKETVLLQEAAPALNCSRRVYTAAIQLYFSVIQSNAVI